MMSPRFISVLIIARPGIFRDSLTALISAIPYVDRIYQEFDPAAALKRVIQARPALVLWDADLPGDAVRSGLATLKGEYPHAVYLILIAEVSQEQLLIRAGADAVLIKGTHADKLLATIEAIVSRDHGTTPGASGCPASG